MVKDQFSRRTIPAELGTSDIAAHGGEAPMARVAHDSFIGDAVAIGRGHEAGTQPVRTDRFRERSLRSRLSGALKQDLTDRVWDQPCGLDRAAAIHFSK